VKLLSTCLIVLAAHHRVLEKLVDPMLTVKKDRTTQANSRKVSGLNGASAGDHFLGDRVLVCQKEPEDWARKDQGKF
jgi:hypothetical protein